MRLDKLEGVVKLVRLDKLDGGVNNATYWTGLQELDETERSGKDGTGREVREKREGGCKAVTCNN